MPGREYPARPIVGVAGVVISGDRVLLIRRGRAPAIGAWSLPGGALKTGETLAQGVAREVREETGLGVEPVEIVATLDRIVRDAEGRTQFHYVLVDWLCLLSGAHGESGREPQAAGDALEAAWIAIDQVAALPGLDRTAVRLIAETRARAEARR